MTAESPLCTETPRLLSSPSAAMSTSPATSGPCSPATAVAQTVQHDLDITMQGVESQGSIEIAWEGDPGSTEPVPSEAAPGDPATFLSSHVSQAWTQSFSFSQLAHQHHDDAACCVGRSAAVQVVRARGAAAACGVTAQKGTASTQ